MKLALSNLAWDYKESIDIFNFIKKNNINNIECVLTKIDDWSNLNSDLINEYSNFINGYGIKTNSMQSLFFGLDINSLNDYEIIVNHIDNLINYSKILGINTMVFGSPNLRKKYIGWEGDLIRLFNVIDSMLDYTNINMVIEPNASIYGGEYFLTLDEIIGFIEHNKFVNIKTMIDTHNLILENNDPVIELLKYKDYIKHIHISEKNLDLFKTNEMHQRFSNQLNKIDYKGIVTYEVKKQDNLLDSIVEFSKIYN